MDSYDSEAVPDVENNDVRPSDHTEEDEKSSHPHAGDADNPGKIFVGGLARETTSAEFVKHFGKYGEITDSVIMKDRKTGQPRGFGFVTYADPSVVDKVIEDTHVINGKQVEIKRTIPRGAGGTRDFKTKKIFVGGIPSAVDDDEFKSFFMQFGEVKEHQIMRDHTTGRSRGFGFITFDTEQAVDDLLARGNRLDLAGAQVEIKKAEPKRPNVPVFSSRRYNDSRSSFGGGYSDAYGSYAGGYRSDGPYGSSRASGYGGYGGSEFGGYGGYGSGLGSYRGEPSLAYSSRYGGGGYSRGYGMGGGYVGSSEMYSGGYGGSGSAYGGSAGGGYSGGGYDMGGSGGIGGSGYGGAAGGPFYGGRGSGHGGAGTARYHPYGR